MAKPPKPATAKPAAKPAPKKTPSKVAFPKKNAPPTEREFAARLPLPLGKRFESVRALLKKQKGVSEDLFYYGPRTGWAWRYLREPGQSLCSIMIRGDRLIGIVALDAAAQAAVAWDDLSPAGQKARRAAHGVPSQLWIDLSFEGTGAGDFKLLLKAKLRAMTGA
jgi:hypothetical protein